VQRGAASERILRITEDHEATLARRMRELGVRPH
jgi:hypothetical protein